MSNTPTYNRNYYVTHRDKLGNRKNIRYRKDSKYRKAILVNTKLRNRITRLSRIAKVVHNGRIEVGYRLNTIEMLLGITQGVFIRWRQSGIIPPTPYKDIKEGCLIYPASNVYVFHYIRDRVNSDTWITYDYVRDLLTMLWPHTFWSVNGVIAHVKKQSYLQGKDSREDRQRRGQNTEADWLKTF